MATTSTPGPTYGGRSPGAKRKKTLKDLPKETRTAPREVGLGRSLWRPATASQTRLVRFVANCLNPRHKYLFFITTYVATRQFRG